MLDTPIAAMRSRTEHYASNALKMNVRFCQISASSGHSVDYPDSAGHMATPLRPFQARLKFLKSERPNGLDPTVLLGRCWSTGGA